KRRIGIGADRRQHRRRKKLPQTGLLPFEMVQLADRAYDFGHQLGEFDVSLQVTSIRADFGRRRGGGDVKPAPQIEPASFARRALAIPARRRLTSRTLSSMSLRAPQMTAGRCERTSTRRSASRYCTCESASREKVTSSTGRAEIGDASEGSASATRHEV